MATVKDLILFLQTLPEDSSVEILCEREGYWSTYTEYEPLELPDNYGHSRNVDVYDFRDNQFVKPGDPRYGKVYLNFGGK